MRSSESFNFALWLLTISLTPHVSADGIRATANRLRTFNPATYIASSVASVLPDYDKLLKVAGDDPDTALEELVTAQNNKDKELELKKDEVDAFIETIESIMTEDGMSMPPSLRPSTAPSFAPSTGPSNMPSTMPAFLNPNPTDSSPSENPSKSPSGELSSSPSGEPSGSPSENPSKRPSGELSGSPSEEPSSSPSGEPSGSSSGVPSNMSMSPSLRPSTAPSFAPTARPSDKPSTMPAFLRTRTTPSFAPTGGPSNKPSTMPGFLAANPIDSSPSGDPSSSPSRDPSSSPSREPSSSSSSPSLQPSESPSQNPSKSPNGELSSRPSGEPSSSSSGEPSSSPSREPSSSPSGEPSGSPSENPSGSPSREPSSSPSGEPSSSPSGEPSGRPSGLPSNMSMPPSLRPSTAPSFAPTPRPTVARFLAINPDLTQLNRAVLRAGFENDLFSNFTLFTMFAGTDAAFAAIPADFLFLLFENDEFLPHLRNLLAYNILNGEFFEADFTDGEVLQTFNRETVEVTLNPFRVNGIPISGADNDVSNGAVQIIDDVLAPNWVNRTLLNRVQQDPTLSITNEFLQLSGLGPDINQAANGNFTLLAPTDTAWIALGSELLAFLADPVNLEVLQDVILYHILDGVFTLAEFFPSRINTFQGNFVTVSVTPRLRFNQALAVNGGRDILANNGVLHKIDSVLDFRDGVGGDTILDPLDSRPPV